MSKAYRNYAFEEDEDWAAKEMASGGWKKSSGAGKAYLELKDKSHSSHHHYTSENNGCAEKWLHFLIRGKGLPKGGVEVYPTVKSEDGREIENAIALYKHCKGRKTLRDENDCLKFKLRITSLSSKDQDKRRIVVFNAVNRKSVKSVESAPKTVLSKKTRKRKRSDSMESESDETPQAKQQFQSAEGALKYFKASLEEVINKWTAHIMSLEKKIENQSQMLTSQKRLLDEQAVQIRAHTNLISQFMSQQICNKIKPKLPDIAVVDHAPFSFNANLLQFDGTGNQNSLCPDSVLGSRESSIASLPDFGNQVTFDDSQPMDDLFPKFDFGGLGLLASNISF